VRPDPRAFVMRSPPYWSGRGARIDAGPSVARQLARRWHAHRWPASGRLRRPPHNTGTTPSARRSTSPASRTRLWAVRRGSPRPGRPCSGRGGMPFSTPSATCEVDSLLFRIFRSTSARSRRTFCGNTAPGCRVRPLRLLAGAVTTPEADSQPIKDFIRVRSNSASAISSRAVAALRSVSSERSSQTWRRCERLRLSPVRQAAGALLMGAAQAAPR
jgi:hypothetical protein